MVAFARTDRLIYRRPTAYGDARETPAPTALFQLKADTAKGSPWGRAVAKGD